MQILKWMGGNLPFMDSLTVVSVVASFPVSASFLRAVGNVGNCKCTFNCDVDHGIYAGRFLCTADYHYEDNQLHQLHIRFPELEKNCKRNCIITDKNRGFYVKIIEKIKKAMDFM